MRLGTGVDDRLDSILFKRFDIDEFFVVDGVESSRLLAVTSRSKSSSSLSIKEFRQV